MNDTMIELVPGIRVYEYTKDGKTRYAVHVTPGVHKIDLDSERATRARERLDRLVASPEEKAAQWAELLKLPGDDD